MSAVTRHTEKAGGLTICQSHVWLVIRTRRSNTTARETRAACKMKKLVTNWPVGLFGHVMVQAWVVVVLIWWDLP
jgi:hypothetical protein